MQLQIGQPSSSASKPSLHFKLHLRGLQQSQVGQPVVRESFRKSSGHVFGQNNGLQPLVNGLSTLKISGTAADSRIFVFSLTRLLDCMSFPESSLGWPHPDGISGNGIVRGGRWWGKPNCAESPIRWDIFREFTEESGRLSSTAILPLSGGCGGNGAFPCELGWLWSKMFVPKPWFSAASDVKQRNNNQKVQITIPLGEV